MLTADLSRPNLGTMRLRALVPWLLLPPLLGVALASWVVTRAVADDRAESSALAGLALRDDVVTTSYAWVTGETSNLLALDAFTRVPSSMDWLDASVAAWDGTARDVQISALRASDGAGPGCSTSCARSEAPNLPSRPC